MKITLKNAKLNWVRLPIDSVDNCRELGGYNTQYGEQTKWHAFLRSSELSRLSTEDIAFLKAYGVKTVIDLREDEEIAKQPNPLANEEFCQYHNIPLMARQQTSSHILESIDKLHMGDLYVGMLERSDAFKDVFDVIGDAAEGCVLFHCQAGKDRTGLIAMLLLGIAGVEKKDIVTNYEVTYTNLESMLRKYAGQSERTYPQEVMYSSPAYISQAYEHIQSNYGSCERYLQAKGVSEETINRVKLRLIEDSKATALQA